MRTRLAGLVAALMVMPSAAMASGTEAVSAQQYVDRIYTALPSDGFNFREVHYTRELAALIARDAAVPEGYVGVLNFNPFCGCQDFAQDYAFTSHAVATAGDATVTVILANGGRQTFTIDLIYSGRGWGVADIHSSDIPSLLAFMRANVAMVVRQ